MKVELIYSPGCVKCLTEREPLREIAEQADANLDWRELNVLDELDYAVSLGVLTLPAIAINGTLVFKSLPAPAELEAALRQRLKRDS